MSAIDRQPKVHESLDRGRAIEDERLVAKLHALVMDGNVTALIVAF